MRQTSIIGCILSAWILAILFSPASAQVYDANADFSAAANPAGVWTYGYEATVGGALQLFTVSESDANIDTWHARPFSSGFPNYYPLLAYNRTSSVYHAGVVLQPREFRLTAGPSGEFTVLRWTAPVAGAYRIAAVFESIEEPPPSRSDVFILMNGGTHLFDGHVDGPANGASYVSGPPLVLLPGSTIDFVVGALNGTLGSVDAGLFASVTRVGEAGVPEPAPSAIALGATLSCVFAAARRRRHKTNGISAPGCPSP